MSSHGERSCTWLAGRKGSIVTITPAAWWVAITRNPRSTRYRTQRNGALRVLCQQRKGSDL